MGKRTEDEIQRRLVELEVAMKQEQQVKAAQEAMDEDAIIVTDEEDDALAEEVRKAEEKIKKKVAKAAKPKKGEVVKTGNALADLYQVGGYASLGTGFIILLSMIRVYPNWFAFYNSGAGLLFFPLMAGIGMMIYNYKSKVAQVLTVGSLAVLIVTIFLNMSIGFPGLSLLSLILLMLPIVGGCVLLAKSFAARREAEERKLLK